MHAVYKPVGITSFSVVHKIRKATQVKRVGHGGTLDPFAEGVLPIGIGRAATRQLGQFLKGDKEYLANVQLGVETDTYDLTGQVVHQVSGFEYDREDIERVIAGYRGEIEQTPPAFSAIKLQGRRAYNMARKGQKFELKPRQIKIHELELLDVSNDGFQMRVVCSHGTYIRSIAHDIGGELGCGAHLSGLVRTRVGEMLLEDCLQIESFEGQPSCNPSLQQK
ncbi:tRNA pseudouridine(55) synthase TruB [Calditrichota bacterium]